MVHLTGETLSIEDLVRVARGGARVAPLAAEVTSGMMASYDWVQRAMADGERVVYGVNTGYGPLARQRIPADQARRLSRNLVLTCMVGVGEPLPPDLVRGMMLVRANSLAKGLSGVRPKIVEALIDMLNAGVVPWVPAKGSVGASGDLAPLAYIAVVLTCSPEDEESGRAWFGGDLLSGEEAMRRAGVERLVSEPKEGFALTNGTSFMAAAGALAVHDAQLLLRHAEVAAALSMEGLRALSAAFHPALHESNNQPGQVRCAAHLRRLLQGSRLIDSSPEHVQDAYSIRCTPQVLGPIDDILGFLQTRITAAINAAADNPLILARGTEGGEGRALSGGNFHGEGLALWLDYLGIAMAEVAGLAERRTFRLLTPELNDGLPSMLVPTSGLDSGLMMPQYTAAALVSENKTLAHPDSVDSIPTSANQEDHVSMGANAALHTRTILENVRTVLAIELLTAAQAIDLRPRGAESLGQGTRVAYQRVREKAAVLVHDRPLAPEMAALSDLIHSGAILHDLEAKLSGWAE
jgi:histidine ammonia-lyase